MLHILSSYEIEHLYPTFFEGSTYEPHYHYQHEKNTSIVEFHQLSYKYHECNSNYSKFYIDQ